MKTRANAQAAKENKPMRNIRPDSSRRGFTLIELAIVLAIAGVLFVGLWKLLAGGNQQIKDSTAASQQEQLITAVKAFLASPEGRDFMTVDTTGAQRQLNAQFGLALPGVGAGGSVCPTINIAGLTQPQATAWCNLLPPGFSATSANAYGQTFSIGVRRDGTTPVGSPPRTYSFMIVTVGGDTIPDSSGGRISAQMGADGGFRYTNPVCGSPANAALACGAFGAWSANPLTEYGLTALGGHIASRTFSSPEDSSVMPWLARIFMPGDTDFRYNTMVADLYMGKKSVAGVETPTDINMKGVNDPQDTGGNLNMHGGKIDLQPGTGRLSDPSLYASVQPSGGTQRIKLNDPLALLSVANPSINNTGNILESASAPLLLLRGGCTTSIAVNNPLVPKPPNVHYDASCGTTMQVDGDVSVIKINTYDAYGYTFFYTSDRRLKSDVKPISSALQTIMKIEPVSFKFNNTKHRTMGVIAQDIEKIYPDIVSDGGKDGMKAVAYHELIAPMIAAIQELKRENDNLRRQLEEQANRIGIIENTNK